jgi:hypothetical protein
VLLTYRHKEGGAVLVWLSPLRLQTETWSPGRERPQRQGHCRVPTVFMPNGALRTGLSAETPPGGKFNGALMTGSSLRSGNIRILIKRTCVWTVPSKGIGIGPPKPWGSNPTSVSRGKTWYQRLFCSFKVYGLWGPEGVRILVWMLVSPPKSSLGCNNQCKSITRCDLREVL